MSTSWSIKFVFFKMLNIIFFFSFALAKRKEVEMLVSVQKLQIPWRNSIKEFSYKKCWAAHSGAWVDKTSVWRSSWGTKWTKKATNVPTKQRKPVWRKNNQQFISSPLNYHFWEGNPIFCSICEVEVIPNTILTSSLDSQVKLGLFLLLHAWSDGNLKLFGLSRSKLSGARPWALWQTLQNTVILICFHAAEHFSSRMRALLRGHSVLWARRVLSLVAPRGGVHCCHAFLRPLKGNDDRGDWDFALPAMHIRHTDRREDKLITVFAGDCGLLSD